MMPTNVNYRANLFALKEVSYLFEHKEAVCGPHILVSFVSLLSLSLSLSEHLSLLIWTFSLCTSKGWMHPRRRLHRLRIAPRRK